MRNLVWVDDPTGVTEFPVDFNCVRGRRDEAEDGSQSITVNLVNEQFRSETAGAQVKIALADAPSVSPEIVLGISGAVTAL